MLIKKVERRDDGSVVLDGVVCSAQHVNACRMIADAWGLDAAETMAFALQLQVVKNKVYKKLYQQLKARTFVNVSNEAGPAADTMVYRVWDAYVSAKLLANYGTDLEMVTASAKEFGVPFASFGAAYSYTIQDIRRAQQTGTPLETALADAAKRAIEQSMDDVLSKGIPSKGTYGLLNHPNVPRVVLTYGNWAGITDPLQIINAINQMVQAVITNSGQIWEPDTILFPTSLWPIVAQTPVGANADKTILNFIQSTNPYLKNFDQWTKLDTAGDDGGPRIMVYKRDAEAQEGEIGQEFEQFPAQMRGLEFVVPCHARAAGVVWRHPKSAVYADNAA